MRVGKQWMHTRCVIVEGHKVMHTAGNTNDCHCCHNCNHHDDFCSADIGSEQCYHVRL